MRYLRNVRTEAKPDTTRPVSNSQADATQTSLQLKNWVKVKSGATLESIIALKPTNTPVETNQPKTAANIPSSKNGN